MRHQLTKKPLPLQPGHVVLGTSAAPGASAQISPVPVLTGLVLVEGRGVVGRADPIPRHIAAHLYWPPDPADACAPTHQRRFGGFRTSGSYVVRFEDRIAGPLPRPLDEAERLVVVYTTVHDDEIHLEVPIEYGAVESSAYLPVTRNDSTR
jgi:hypothetical protein